MIIEFIRSGFVSIDDIDIEKLRKDLIDYFTGAMFMVSPVALIDLTEVENASDEKLIQIALDNRFDLTKYQVKTNEDGF